jgi:hypothetical protein
VAHRTTLYLSRDAPTPELLKKIFPSDVEVGDPAFDERFLVLGSDRDVARGVMVAPAVRAAMEVLFELDVWSCRLDKRGRLIVNVRRKNLSEDVARRALDATRQLAEALHAQTEARALSPPLDDKVPSAGAGSGAPVGVRTTFTTGRKR